MDAISLTQRVQPEDGAGARVATQSSLRSFVVAELGVWLVALLAAGLTGCTFLSGGGSTGTLGAGERGAVASTLHEDGPVFVGFAPRVPGSYGKLVLEKNFPETRTLRWRSNDARIGSAEVDFFAPRDWKLEGDPPSKLSFADRSPGPVLFGEVGLAPHSRATVTVVLGGDRVTYSLERVDRNGTR